MRLLIATLLIFCSLWVRPATADGKVCDTTKQIAANLTSAGYAFTATFVTSRGIVMQLYKSPLDGFVITWVRDLGEVSCILVTGSTWIWAGEPI